MQTQQMRTSFRRWEYKWMSPCLMCMRISTENYRRTLAIQQQREIRTRTRHAHTHTRTQSFKYKRLVLTQPEKPKMISKERKKMRNLIFAEHCSGCNDFAFFLYFHGTHFPSEQNTAQFRESTSLIYFFSIAFVSMIVRTFFWKWATTTTTTASKQVSTQNCYDF